MSRKREISAATSPMPPSKRVREASTDSSLDGEEQGAPRPSRPSQQPKLDATYGQRSAFPELDNDDDIEGLQYADEPSDGIEYLRMVRTEARGVPHLLVAPRADNASDDYIDPPKNGGYGGYYYDGAYTAAPINTTAEIDDRHISTQTAYYKSLLLRFSVLRATLKCTPPLSAIEKLSSSHPISFPPNSKKAYKEWRDAVHTTDPQMTQLACMDMASSLLLIRLLTKLLPSFIRSRSIARIDRMGSWIWATLGKCWEVGQLNSEEVGELRELGKISAGALYGFKDRSGNVYGVEEELEDEEQGVGDTGDTEVAEGPERDGANEGEEADPRPMSDDSRGEFAEEEALEAAKMRLQDKLQDEQPADGDRPLSEDCLSETETKDGEELDFETRARATLDMVLTIVGELYGQRDLLDLRDEWAIEDALPLPTQRTS